MPGTSPRTVSWLDPTFQPPSTLSQRDLGRDVEPRRRRAVPAQLRREGHRVSRRRGRPPRAPRGWSCPRRPRSARPTHRQVAEDATGHGADGARPGSQIAGPGGLGATDSGHGGGTPQGGIGQAPSSHSGPSLSGAVRGGRGRCVGETTRTIRYRRRDPGAISPRGGGVEDRSCRIVRSNHRQTPTASRDCPHVTSSPSSPAAPDRPRAHPARRRAGAGRCVRLGRRGNDPQEDELRTDEARARRAPPRPAARRRSPATAPSTRPATGDADHTQGGEERLRLASGPHASSGTAPARSSPRTATTRASRTRPQRPIKGWIGSSTHRSILLSKGYNYVGFGCAMIPDNRRRYWAGRLPEGSGPHGARGPVRGASKRSVEWRLRRGQDPLVRRRPPPAGPDLGSPLLPDPAAAGRRRPGSRGATTTATEQDRPLVPGTRLGVPRPRPRQGRQLEHLGHRQRQPLTPVSR